MTLFIQELRQISDRPEASQQGNFSFEDMRKELSIQIAEALSHLNYIYDSLKNEFNVFSSLEKEIAKIKSEVEELRSDMNNNLADISQAVRDDSKLRLRKWFRTGFLHTIAPFNYREILWIVIIVALMIKLIFFKN